MRISLMSKLTFIYGQDVSVELSSYNYKVFIKNRRGGKELVLEENDLVILMKSVNRLESIKQTAFESFSNLKEAFIKRIYKFESLDQLIELVFKIPYVKSSSTIVSLAKQCWHIVEEVDELKAGSTWSVLYFIDIFSRLYSLY